MYNIVLFSQGAAFMFFLTASFYFLSRGADRLRLILGCVLAYGVLVNLVDLALVGLDEAKEKDFVDSVYVYGITIIPICGLFLYELVNPHKLTLKMVLIHEIPFLLFVVLYVITRNEDLYQISLIFAVLYSVIFAVFLVMSISRYHKKIKELYSHTENLEIKWVWWIFGLFVTFLIAWVCVSFVDYKVGRAFYYAGRTMVWVLICYFVDRHQIALNRSHLVPLLENPMHEESNVPVVADEPESIVIPKDEDIEIKEVIQQYHFSEKLKTLFEIQKIYLRDVTLNDVAAELCTNRTYLSDYLNRVLETTFFDYVNEHRLEHATDLLVKESSLTLEQVAESSGFNSLSTFRRAFKKRYSCTPQDYRKNPEILV